MKKHYFRTAAILLCVVFLSVALYFITDRMPMQKLRITAVTTAQEFDMAGTTDLYCFKSLDTGRTYTAVIKFIAVEDTSESLFARFGTGQLVYLGCSELQAEYDFLSVGQFLHIRLTLNAAQTDLKLEDGTPFDITRYSLKPVLIIEE